MNVVLFEKNEDSSFLSLSDPRAKHILKVLGLKKGDKFRVGLVSSHLDHAVISDFSDSKILLRWEGESIHKRQYPVHLILGLMRPIVAKRLLKDLSSMAVSSISFMHTNLGEKSYYQSSLWQNYSFHQYLLEGASQGGHYHIPEIRFFSNREDVISKYRHIQHKIILEPAESANNLTELLHALASDSIVAAIGSERGWTASELQNFQAAGYQSVSLGAEILRTETAANVCASLVKLMLYC